MGILICIKKKKAVKIFRIGDILQYLVIVSAVCKDASKLLEKEKGFTSYKAMEFLFNCVDDVKDSLKQTGNGRINILDSVKEDLENENQR